MFKSILERKNDDVVLKLACSNLEIAVKSNGLTLNAIGLYFYLDYIYKQDVFYWSGAESLSFKKSFTKDDINKGINELIDKKYIEIVG